MLVGGRFGVWWFVLPLVCGVIVAVLGLLLMAARMPVWPPVLGSGAVLLVVGAAAVLGEWIVPRAEDRHWQELAALTGRPRVAGGHVLFREVRGGQTSVFYARGFGDREETLVGLTLNQFEGGRLVRVIEAGVVPRSRETWAKFRVSAALRKVRRAFSSSMVIITHIAMD